MKNHESLKKLFVLIYARHVSIYSFLLLSSLRVGTHLLLLYVSAWLTLATRNIYAKYQNIEMFCMKIKIDTIRKCVCDLN